MLQDIIYKDNTFSVKLTEDNSIITIFKAYKDSSYLESISFERDVLAKVIHSLTVCNDTEHHELLVSNEAASVFLISRVGNPGRVIMTRVGPAPGGQLYGEGLIIDLPVLGLIIDLLGKV